jgi:endonuclease YncB( thermonuclease family)
MQLPAVRWKAMALLLAAMIAFPCQADISGTVIAIQDGDTLTVLDESNMEHRVRLTGIDAPEKRQAYGQRAKQSLSDCAFSKDAMVEGGEIDRYGRLVGKVIVQGVDCNKRQIDLGLAWHYKQYQKEQTSSDRQRYAQVEEAARALRVGLWADDEPIPPWNFRRP